MSERLNSDQDPQFRLKVAVAEKATEQLGWLNEAAQVVGGPEAKPADVFDLPPEVRNDAPMPDLSPEQEEAIREVAQRFGYGAKENVPSGLTGAVCVAEGGKIWKMMAEAEAMKGEDNPRRYVFAGSPYRQLGADEHKFMKEVVGEELPENATEYDAAYWLALRQTDKKVPIDPVVLHFGYEVSEGNPPVYEATGQLIHVGQTEQAVPVEVLRIDREVYEEDGKSKYRFQPAPDRVMGFMSEVLAAQGDREAKVPVAYMTSNTYASRVVDAIRAGIREGRQFGVSMYGRNTILGLGAPAPKETPLNQLPGDLRITHDNLQQLLREVS